MSRDIYSVFGNKVRVKLILCLSDRSKSVSELITTCRLSQSAVSQHLSKLKDAGIVKTKKEGKEVFYSLKSKKSVQICKLLLSLGGK